MFWVAPLIGGAIGGGLYAALFSQDPEPTVRSAMAAEPKSTR
jgi:hypothetical protein